MDTIPFIGIIRAFVSVQSSENAVKDKASEGYFSF